MPRKQSCPDSRIARAAFLTYIISIGKCPKAVGMTSDDDDEMSKIKRERVHFFTWKCFFRCPLVLHSQETLRETMFLQEFPRFWPKLYRNYFPEERPATHQKISNFPVVSKNSSQGRDIARYRSVGSPAYFRAQDSFS